MGQIHGRNRRPVELFTSVKKQGYNVKIVRAYFAAEGIPDFVTEHQFATSVEFQRKDGRTGNRAWAFDFAWLEHKVALEVEGGVFIQGGHTTGSGFTKDMRKYNTATILGWRILRCLPKELCMQETVQMLKQVLK